MTQSVLQFAQKCLSNVDHDFLTLFDLKEGVGGSFSTYPEEWCSHYISQQYYNHDYVLLRNLYLPIFWGENLTKNITPIQQKIFKEAQDFQIHKGITVPFITPNFREFITVVFNKHDKSFTKGFLSLSTDLMACCQMIFTYKHVLTNESESQHELVHFLEEIASWQKTVSKQKNKHDSLVAEILSNIRTAQMFITQHETKDLALETLQKAYKDVERLN